MKAEVERGVSGSAPKKRPLVRCDSESIALKVNNICYMDQAGSTVFIFSVGSWLMILRLWILIPGYLDTQKDMNVTLLLHFL